MASRRIDLLLGGAGAAFGAGSLAAQGYGAVAIASGAVLGSALGIYRPHPRTASFAAVAGLVAMAPFVDEIPLGTFLLVPAVAFCAGRWEGRWGSLMVLLSLIAAWEVTVALSHDAYVPVILIPAAAWGAGRALREREQVADKLAERARELEDEREAHAALSVRYERARIASELHDIVAHAISVMVVQASAGQRLAARDPEATAEAFDAIAGAAHEAEEDMGRLVALLGDERAIGPAPDLALVEELVARGVGSVLDVTLRLEGEREGLPALIVETAYRVVQEGITNALRYAAGAAVRVLVTGNRTELVVVVENAPAASARVLAGTGTGHGLSGLRERLSACGGTLSAGATPDGGWLLHARLPRRAIAGAR